MLRHMPNSKEGQFEKPSRVISILIHWSEGSAHTLALWKLNLELFLNMKHLYEPLMYIEYIEYFEYFEYIEYIEYIEYSEYSEYIEYIEYIK